MNTRLFARPSDSMDGDDGYDSDDGKGGGRDDLGGRRRGGKKKVCRYCADKTLGVDYRDTQALRFFVTERGKIVPRRISGNCARHQRSVTRAIKQARNIALLPFTAVE